MWLLGNLLFDPGNLTTEINSRYKGARLNVCRESCNDRAQIYGVVFTMKRHDPFLFDLHHPKRKLVL